MKKLFLFIISLIYNFSNAQDFNTYLGQANKALEKGMYTKAYENATKAIELNEYNNDARWLRIQSLMTSNATGVNFEKAIADLNFIISNNGASSKIYNALGVAESELASDIYRFKKAKENDSFSDDNTSFIREQKEYFNEAIMHYENAKKAFKNSADINPEAKDELKYKIQDSDRSIKAIKEEISLLK
ncbi:hypothetical protein [Flavobacterium johnsoniae]|uniref:Tetratricopeptide repeat protein n=1 Tax=Flavobacterium johnsoniae TaxID=986 RepID=A0A1M5IZ03_FLAJO|nr:hypothetical protein [Flavobacterium johnsoniae]SHG33210.1 hypothetical protein SAMN05444388_102301 [Flavobacterium johnsoniae]